MLNKKQLDRAKFRKTKAGKEFIEGLMAEFPYVVVYWGQGKKKKREYCDLRRAAAILNVSIETIHERLDWNGGSWETENFMVQRAHVETWLKEVARQRSEGS